MKPNAITGALALCLLAAPALADGKHAGGHGDDHAMGRSGDAQDVTRTVEVAMLEPETGGMAFTPGEMRFEAGETVRFVIRNEGEFDHEFTFNTEDEIVEHKALMERFPEMEHDEPNAVTLAPGETGEIVWTFSEAGSFEFACLIPGHYDLGMHGPLLVN